MKKLFAVFIIAAGFTACNGSSNSSGTPVTDTVPVAEPGADTSAMKMDSASMKMDTTTMKMDTTTKM
ncbi:MAG: hypothetical protein ABI415_04490 [Flavitalea sp.]